MRPKETGVEKLDIIRVTRGQREAVEDVVVKESPLSIVLNGKELVTLLCTPEKLDFLAAGFLFSEGLIESRKDIRKILIDRKRGVAWVETRKAAKVSGDFTSRRYITTGCGRGTTFVDVRSDKKMRKIVSKTKIHPLRVAAIMREFMERSETHRLTGGVHGAALCDAREVLVFAEDIGRHSAIDKVLGECLMKGMETKGKILVTSGRISSEILLKTARARIPILISKSAPTSIGVKLAQKLGVTLIGFARGERMNVYSEARRITSDMR